ncbi:MAG TPA: hypothetical protein VKZ89_00655 [Thermobifida alba]|nr:hypothetical protein [Thermobifida alba]
MTIPVVWWTSHITCWDQAMVDAALTGRSWPTGYQFEHHVHTDTAPWEPPAGTTGAVLVIPASRHAGDVDAINAQLAALDWALVILTSDEERQFPLDALQHPNLAVWLQYPHAEDRADWMIPVGPTPHLRGLLDDLDYQAKEGWFFAGQVTNTRREQCARALRALAGGRLVETAGFTQGLPHDEYAKGLAAARVVPCPAGPQSVDSFRLAEALEAGCVPVADTATQRWGDQSWFWPQVLPGAPFPTITDWATFPDVLVAVENDWPRVATRCSAWWQRYKREFAQRLGYTINRLSGQALDFGDITVLVSTSPIASHPDTAIIEETIASVRYWLPDAEIIVMCDGVRAEQEHYRPRYEDYLNRLVWLAGTKWNRVLPVIHDDHLHQGELTKRSLDLVQTPMVLFVEHDTPLVTDCPIDWSALTAAVRSGDAEVIRLHHEALVLPDHEHLMLDRTPRSVHGAPLLRTVQWSQRPHLANTGFYRRMLARFFDGRKAMIEDVVHGPVQDDWRQFGLAGWDRWRLWMYAPEGNMKRSYHLDGRGDDPKWELS